MAEHTPTPWDWLDERDVPRLTIPVVSKEHAFTIADVRATVRHAGEANAAFIVKAVNSHDTLVKALEAVADAKMPGEARRIAREALRAVEGAGNA